MSGSTVLVIDDEPRIVEFLVGTFRDSEQSQNPYFSMVANAVGAAEWRRGVVSVWHGTDKNPARWTVWV